MRAPTFCRWFDDHKTPQPPVKHMIERDEHEITETVFALHFCDKSGGGYCFDCNSDGVVDPADVKCQESYADAMAREWEEIEPS